MTDVSAAVHLAGSRAWRTSLVGAVVAGLLSCLLAVSAFAQTIVMPGHFWWRWDDPSGNPQTEPQGHHFANIGGAIGAGASYLASTNPCAPFAGYQDLRMELHVHVYPTANQFSSIMAYIQAFCYWTSNGIPSSSPTNPDVGIRAECPDPQHSPTTGTSINFVACNYSSGAKQKTADCQTDCVRGNPINPGKQNKFARETDLQRGQHMALELTRYYNTVAIPQGYLGVGWRISYSRALSVSDAGGSLSYVGIARDDGRSFSFHLAGGAYVPDADIGDTLQKLVDGAGVATGWQYTSSNNDEVELYDLNGRLLSIANRAGLAQSLSYTDGIGGILYGAAPNPAGYQAPNCVRPVGFTHWTGTGAPPAGLLLCVTDPFGRQINFQYDAQTRIANMRDPAGAQYQFEYDGPSGGCVGGAGAGCGKNNLTKVTYPDGTSRTYSYNEASRINGGVACTNAPAGFPNYLTGITDENGARFASWSYDCSGRATASEHAGGVEKVALTYNTNGTVTITDFVGDAVSPTTTSRLYSFQTLLGVTKRTSIVDPATNLPSPCAGCGSGATDTYDSNGYPASRKDWNGNLTCYKYDTRGLENIRVEGLGGSCPSNLALNSVPSSAPARKITTLWHATYRLPVQVAEPLRITTYVYGDSSDPARGNHGSLLSKTIQATSDSTGAQGLAASSVGTPRTWTYTYNAVGQVLTVDGPRTDAADVTNYTYYPSDDPDFGKRGNAATITNALGHVTQISAYDVYGRPVTVVDPNGLVTNLAYDARGRLTSRDVGGEVTAYAYDGVGQLTKVTLPDGSFLAYSYDAAHRLTQIQDSLGNNIVYTLDAMGNRTKEEVFDPAATLVQRRQREYNSLNRLVKDIGGANPATEITQYGYDSQGNTTTITDPLGKVTTNVYDALNRLVKVIDPAASGSGQGGNTQYAYDGLDQLTRVTDPRALATAYTLDGLGNLSQLQSPDTGTSTSTYDAAGNLTSQTDARGVVATFSYDALNRLTQANYTPPGGSGISPVTLTYSYDQGTYGTGRLTGFTDPSGSTAYSWDQKGRMLSETRAVSGVPYSTSYAYDAFGRLSRITYPSGRTVDYGFDALGRVQEIDTASGGVSEPLVTGVAYQPFGAARSFLFGNAAAYSRSIDLDGRISAYGLAGLTRTLAFDAGSRITGFTHDQPAYDQSFGYDNLGRLTGWSGSSSSQSYGYDPTGNRTSLGIGASTYPYTVAPTSNRLTQTDGAGGVKAFGFDAAGNTTAAGAQSFGYDARGRMVSANTALGAVSYQVNALGQRVAKQAPAGTTVFHYDREGRLIAESDPAGNVQREYVWLGSQPVAMLTAGQMYYVQADHLGTPRAVTNQANTIVWRWDSDPFGSTPPNDDPSGLGAFAVNLRFPGQYFDKETALHYNYFRDYDPQTGRYVQPDPIGLRGGINTYGYVDGNPLSRTDPLGLVPIAPAIAACAANPVCLTLATGTAIAAGNAIIGTINAISGASSSSGNDSPSNVIPFPTEKPQDVCPPGGDAGDNFCKRQQESLNNQRKLYLTMASQRMTLSPRWIQQFNDEVRAHNLRCPKFPVDPISPSVAK